MFDIGFSELMVIAVVALVVLGPERLPKVARTAGHLFGRLQRYVNDVKADINREIELDELRKFKTEFETAAQTVESDLRTGMSQAEASIKGDIDKVDTEIKAWMNDGIFDPHVPPAATPEIAAAPADAALPPPAGEEELTTSAPAAASRTA
jgi:sec-independent protein translocase protein TatB